MGGAVAAVEQGFMQREIHRAALETQRRIESGEEVVVGVNRFRMEEEPEPQLLRVDPSLAKRQIERLKDLRSRRDAGKVEESLAALKRAAEGTDNLMPYILDAVRAYATVGEICHALREVFGEYQPV